MTDRAKRLLVKISNTEEAALRLTRGNVKAAEELRRAGLAVLIPISLGGADVCLTSAGIAEAVKEVPTS